MKKTNIGRPEDNWLEKNFMNKLRDRKLQLLNSECDFTILMQEMFQFHSNFILKSLKRGPPRRSAERNPQDLIAQQIQFFIIGELQQNEKNQLTKVFSELCERWQFEEFQDSLPQYLFDDGSDLSYIIDGVQKEKREIIQNFPAETLIFLMLLCLEKKKMLNEKSIHFYQTNMSLMIEAMNYGIKKVKKQVENDKNTKDQASTMNTEMSFPEQTIKSKQIESDSLVSQYISKTDDKDDEILEEQQEQKATGKRSKRKGIRKQKNTGPKEKDKKSKEKKSKAKCNASKEEFIERACNYMCWAYYYVYQES